MNTSRRIKYTKIISQIDKFKNVKSNDKIIVKFITVEKI